MCVELRDHVLIVEDNLIMADVLKRALVRSGLEVTVARNGVEACNLTRERKFAVIVTDFNMPRMNGDEFVRNLRLTSLNSDAPVIFVSGKGLEVDTEQMRRELEIHAFLFKGMMSWHVWPWGYAGLDKGGDWKSNGALSRVLYEVVEGKPFKWSRPMKDDIRHRVKLAIETLGLHDSPADILNRFIACDFPGEWIKAEKRMRKARSSGQHRSGKTKPKRKAKSLRKSG